MNLPFVNYVTLTYRHWKPFSSPWTGGIPKVEQKIRMDSWNIAVDEYIASGVDNRLREDIENESKIGLGGGPLHALCENEMCNEPREGRTYYDGRPPTKLLVCIGCKKVRTSK